MARTKNQARKGKAKQGQNQDHHQQQQERSPKKKTLMAPKLGCKREKSRIKTKKQLIQREKKAKKRHQQEDYEDAVQIVTTAASAKSKSLFGPLSNKKINQQKQQQKQQKQQQQQQKQQKKRKSRQHEDSIQVIFDGTPLHTLQHPRSRRNNNGTLDYGRSKTPPFQLKTIQNPKGCTVPWWTEKDRDNWMDLSCQRRSQQPDNNNTNNSKKQQSKRHYLFGNQKQQCPHEEWLALLDAELEQFAAYVRLSPREHQARDFIVSMVQNVSRTHLDLGASRLSRHQGAIDQNNIRVDVFGSFATPSVCAFCSDVDMALFGLVPTEQEEEEETRSLSSRGTHIRFGTGTSCEVAAAATAAKSTSSSKLVKVQKWKDLLDECYQQRMMTDKEDAFMGDHPVIQVDDSSDDSSNNNKNKQKKKVVNHPVIEVDDDSDNNEDDEEPQVEWQNALDEFLNGANEGPDSVPYHGHDHHPEDAVASKDKNDADKTVLPDPPTTTDDDKKDVETSSELFVSDSFFVLDRVGADEPTAREEKKEEQEHEINHLDASDDQKEAAVNKTPEEDPSVSHRKRSLSETIHSASDSEDDTADKLASLHARKQSPLPGYQADVGNGRQPDTEQAVISLSSDDEDEEDDDDEEVDDMHVSFVAHPPTAASKSMGPSGAVRAEVVNVLSNLGSILRKRQFTQTVQVIRKAKVPIVKFQTKLGFEGDVAMGGHNGTDTSQFAMSQAARFQSFATVVMALKILLWQQNLDTPFHGGLGSYKLYVLVSHHLERHLELGGSDRPGEVFLSFLYRYGQIRRGIGMFDDCHQKARSFLTMNTVLDCCDGEYSADMSPTFLLRHCIELFRRCFMQVAQESAYTKPPKKGSSILRVLYDIERLERDRTESLRKAALLDSFQKGAKKDAPTQQQQQQQARTCSDNSGGGGGGVPSGRVRKEPRLKRRKTR